MKYRNIIITGLALALTLTCGSAQAQLGGLKKKPAAGDVAGQQNKLMKDYSAAGVLLTKAMELTIEALGTKAEADEFRAQAKDIKGEAKDKKGCEYIHTVLSSGSKKVEELIAKADKLTAEQKAKVKESLVPFGEGLAIDAGLIALSVETTKQAQEEVKSNPLAATKFAPALYIASVLPGDVKAIGQSLNNYIKLAKKNDIEISSDITKGLPGPQ